MDKSHIYYVDGMKPDTRDYMPGDSTYIKFKNRQPDLWHHK